MQPGSRQGFTIFFQNVVDPDETDFGPGPLVCLICKEPGTDLKPASVVWTSLKRAAELRLEHSRDKFGSVLVEINSLTEPGYSKYHSKCHKTFTAVKRRASASPSEPPAKVLETRTTSSLPKTYDRGLLKGSCIFCGKKRKIVNGTEEKLSNCETQNGCEAIFSNARNSNIERISSLARSNVDLIAKEAQYHKTCRRQYFYDTGAQTVQQGPSTNRQLHATTFEIVVAFIETEVIQKQRAMLCTAMLKLYSAEFLSNGGHTEDIESYTTQMLMNKITNRFGESVTVAQYNKRQGNFFFPSILSEADARTSFHDQQINRKEYEDVRSVALYLRSVIMNMAKWKTPEPVKAHTLKSCSPDLPELLTVFYETLLCGLSEPKGEHRETIEKKVMALSSDAMYNTSRGTVRPWKQTVMGLGLSTLTGSKLVLRMLNRHGHCINYDEVKALETEFAYSATESDRDTPDGLSLEKGLGTGSAWDNYDVNIETIDGKMTLHATVGHTYQNQSVRGAHVQGRFREGRNRRRYIGQERPIPPFRTPLNKAKFTFSADVRHAEQIRQLGNIDLYWFLKGIAEPMPLYAGSVLNSFTIVCHSTLSATWIPSPDPRPRTTL